MPELAREAGAFIVGTGRSDYPNQINNSLVFPGFWRGMLDAQQMGTYKNVNTETFVTIAEALASYVTDLRPDNMLPNMFDKGVVKVIADMVSK